DPQAEQWRLLIVDEGQSREVPIVWSGTRRFHVILNEDPMADAGPDVYAGDQTLVALDGTGSSDPNKDPLSYLWISPPEIVLSSNTASDPTFITPEIVDDTVLIFVLQVNDGLEDSSLDTIRVMVIHNTIEITDTTISSVVSECRNAFTTITLAGDGNPVVFGAGSTITLIAGQSIRFLSGFFSERGSYLLASISDGNSFCDESLPESMLAQPVEKSRAASQLYSLQMDRTREKQIRVYPNPNDGRFQVALSRFEGEVQLTVRDVLGKQIYKQDLLSREFIDVGLPYAKPGLYFVLVKDCKNVYSSKIVIR
ncbi:MAG TPA: T9SS type A sorting domain-containing protein, partial [Prolixibacteraceae bacterium]|nr:T9SS type A sorting domain-containing protein [Prolixibacteraceae bacterium]